MAITQDLSNIIDINVTISAAAATRRMFNQGLILGASPVIPSGERIRAYDAVSALLEDGFTSSSPEYIAATLYFGDSSVQSAPSRVWIGRRVTTYSAILSATINTAGTGYVQGDILTPLNDGGSGAKLTVGAVDSGGGVTSISITEAGAAYAGAIGVSTQNLTGTGSGCLLNLGVGEAIAEVSLAYGGLGYAAGDTLEVDQDNGNINPAGSTLVVDSVDNGMVSAVSLTDGGEYYYGADSLGTTSSGSGTGCLVNIVTASAESIVDALAACRAADGEWYGCFAIGAAKADHLAIAAWAASATPTTIYFYNSSDSDIPTGSSSNVFNTLKTASYGRVIGQYSSLQGWDDTAGAYTNPSAAYAIVPILGYAMGATSGLPNSTYTLMFKRDIGIIPEPLTATQVTNITKANGNVYLNYGNYYNIFQAGVMASGYYFDEVINLDVLVNNIQLTLMDLLYQNRKVPQTDVGMTTFINAINRCCEEAVSVGYVAPDIWTGSDILALKYGDMLPLGYLVQTYPMAYQSAADRSARKSTPILIAVKLAGAIQHITIGVNVNR